MPFDWTRMLKQAPATEEGAGAERAPKAERSERRQSRRTPDTGRRTPVPTPEPATARAERTTAAAPEPPEPAPESPAQSVEPELAAIAGEAAMGPVEPLHLEEAEDEFDAAAAPRPEDYTTAAYQRLGAEGLARLRARWAEVMARISERQLDEAAREELKARAERLNPDAWVTADEVTAGLEQYEAVYESLRAVVGQRRRRRRRR